MTIKGTFSAQFTVIQRETTIDTPEGRAARLAGVLERELAKGCTPFSVVAHDVEFTPDPPRYLVSQHGGGPEYYGVEDRENSHRRCAWNLSKREAEAVASALNGLVESE